MAGSVYIYNAGGVVGEDSTPQNDVTQLRSLFEAMNVPSTIDIVVGEGGNVTPQSVVGMLNSGHVVVQWCGWPFYGIQSAEAFPTGTSQFSTVIRGAWVNSPGVQPPPESAFNLFRYGLMGPWDFNPQDFKFGPYIKNLYPYSRAFITTSIQNNGAIPFHSAPTSSAFPNFNFPYAGRHYYGYSGIQAFCSNNGVYFWCESHVPVYNVAEFVGQAFGKSVTSSGHTTSHPSTSSHYTPPSNNSTTYTVQSGDTLSSIAAKVCHNANDWPYIAQANNLSSPYTIYPGHTLIVRCSASSSTSTPSTSTSSTSTPSTSTYTPPTTSTPSTSTPSTSTGFMGLTPTEERDGLIVLAAALGVYLIAKDL